MKYVVWAFDILIKQAVLSPRIHQDQFEGVGGVWCL